jgi:hypothetical protein
VTSAFLAGYAALWALFVVELALVFMLLKEVGRFYFLNLHGIVNDGPKLGRRLPSIEVAVSSGTRHLAELLGPELSLILLCKPHSRLSREGFAAAVNWVRSADDTKLIVVFDADANASTVLERQEGLPPSIVLALASSETILRSLQIRARPFLLITSRTGQVLAKTLSGDTEEIDRLARTARRAWGLQDAGPAASADQIAAAA